MTTLKSVFHINSLWKNTIMEYSHFVSISRSNITCRACINCFKYSITGCKNSRQSHCYPTLQMWEPRHEEVILLTKGNPLFKLGFYLICLCNNCYFYKSNFISKINNLAWMLFYHTRKAAFILFLPNHSSHGTQHSGDGRWLDISKQTWLSPHTYLHWDE